MEINQPGPSTAQPTPPLATPKMPPVSSLKPRNIPSESPNKKNWLKILLIILLVIILGAGLFYAGYILGQKKTLTFQTPSPTPTPELTPIPTQAPVTTPTPTIDSTANWLTYTDELYHYSVKYPSEWTTPQFNPLQRNGANGVKLYFIQAGGFMNECMQEIDNSIITIQDLQFKRRDFQGVFSGEMCDDPENTDNYSIWLMSPDEDYGLSFHYNSSIKSSAENTFNQILSTFEPPK